MISTIRFNSLVLGVFAIITAALLAGTHMGTKDRIAAEQKKVAQKALLEIIPRERHTNDLLLDTLPIPSHFLATLGLEDVKETPIINIARSGGTPIAMIVPAIAPDGYNGKIKMIVGINLSNNSIAGVRIVQHNETPGLGDKVDTNKSDWVLRFNDKSLANPSRERWKVKKDGGDFDQFTGATITPRAIVHQIAKVLQYFAEDRKNLLKEASKIKLPQTIDDSEPVIKPAINSSIENSTHAEATNNG